MAAAGLSHALRILDDPQVTLLFCDMLRDALHSDVAATSDACALATITDRTANEIGPVLQVRLFTIMRGAGVPSQILLSDVLTKRHAVVPCRWRKHPCATSPTIPRGGGSATSSSAACSSAKTATVDRLSAAGVCSRRCGRWSRCTLRYSSKTPLSTCLQEHSRMQCLWFEGHHELTRERPAPRLCACLPCARLRPVTSRSHVSFVDQKTPQCQSGHGLGDVRMSGHAPLLPRLHSSCYYDCWQ
jgi:hypothetical protein